MLAPATELHYTEEPLLRLNLDSLARWPEFAVELADVSGLATGFRATGTVLVAWMPLTSRRCAICTRSRHD